MVNFSLVAFAFLWPPGNVLWTRPLRGSARRESFDIPPFAAVTLILGRRCVFHGVAAGDGFLSLFYLTFLAVVFFPRQPIDAKEPQNGCQRFSPTSQLATRPRLLLRPKIRHPQLQQE
jgi:hypothetical protein